MDFYVVQVIIFQMLFYGLYWLCFRRSTFFKMHRWYLLLMPMLALLLPFIKITAFQSVVPETLTAIFLPEVIIGVESTNHVVQETLETSWTFYIWWFYAAGAILSLLFFGYRLRKLLSYFKYQKTTETVIEIPESTEAFTFLNFIFIGKEINTLSRKHILTHERIHAQQKHTWDLMLFELLRIFMWFNPFIYLYQKEIARVHEYLADQAVLKETSRRDYYEKLLNMTFGTNNLSFTNTFFNHSFIQKRIIMLQKSKSKKSELVKYTLIIPMILGMLFYVSCSEDKQPETDTISEDQTTTTEYQELLNNSEGNITESEFTPELYEEYKEVLELEEIATKEDRELTIDESKAKYTNKSNLKKKGIELIETDEGYPRLVRTDIVYDISSVAQSPIFPGCDPKSSNDELKKCLSTEINKIVANNFDTTIGERLNLEGVQRIYCLFKIDSEGKIGEIKVRAKYPELKEETLRVLKIIPDMEPGKLLDGTPVKVSYVLPVIFKIE